MKSSKIFIPSIIILILLALGYVGYAYFSSSNTVAAMADQDQAPIDTTSQTPPADTSATPPVATTSKYKDGTYSATGTYRTPESTEHVAVTLTLASGIITDVNTTINAAIPESVRYQSFFLGNYKPMVVGKDIDNLTISEVSGSSLTSGGFKDAIAQIKAQAATS